MENKKTEKLRVQKGERYYFINRDMAVSYWKEDNYDLDDILFEHGNYFRTRKEAVKATEGVKKALKRYHNELRDFEWALSKMREGLRVSRASWERDNSSHLYIDPTEDNLLTDARINSYSTFFISSEAWLFSDDILADDWELFRPTTI